MKRLLLNFSILLIIGFVCKIVMGSGNDNIVTSKNKLYKITIPNNEWILTKTSNDATVFKNSKKNGTVAIITNPLVNEKLTLNVLVNHLLIEIENKSIANRKESTIDGMKAANVTLNGKVEEKMVRLNIFVMKRKKTAYNIVCWALPDRYEANVKGFGSIVNSFKFVK